jgi:hypothetical protein
MLYRSASKLNIHDTIRSKLPNIRAPSITQVFTQLLTKVGRPCVLFTRVIGTMDTDPALDQE